MKTSDATVRAVLIMYLYSENADSSVGFGQAVVGRAGY